MNITYTGLALRSLTERLTFGTAMLSVLVTAIALGVWFYVMVLWIGSATIFSFIWFERIFDGVLYGVNLLVAWMLFPLLIPAVASLFIDRFLIRIARDEYNRELRNVPLMEELPKSIKFLLLALLLNLFLLPFYLVPLLGQILYFVVNGYLLAREFWEMIADRLLLDQASLKRRRPQLLGLGLTIMVSTIVPLMNLFTPLFAGAIMLHFGIAALQNGRVQQRSII